VGIALGVSATWGTDGAEAAGAGVPVARTAADAALPLQAARRSSTARAEGDTERAFSTRAVPVSHKLDRSQVLCTIMTAVL
jgi:hypothetical protein